MQALLWPNYRGFYSLFALCIPRSFWHHGKNSQYLKNKAFFLYLPTCVTCICSFLIAGLINNLLNTHSSHRGSVNPSEQHEQIGEYESSQHQSQISSAARTSSRWLWVILKSIKKTRQWCFKVLRLPISAIVHLSAVTAFHESPYPPEFGPGYQGLGVPPHIYHQLERHPQCSWKSFPEAINSKCELSLDCSTK